MTDPSAYGASLPEVPQDTPFRREAGEAQCPTCQRILYVHPAVRVAGTHGPMVLRRLCDGTYVKL